MDKPGGLEERASRTSNRDVLRELCHELRQPSATIRVLAAALEIECDLSPQAKARLDHIVAQARLIDQLCSHVFQQDFDTNPLVRLDKIALDEVELRGGNGCCAVEMLGTPVVARIDETSARRIIWNLVDNACRAAGPGGKVLVTVWSTNTEIRLEVSDNGPGFGGASPGLATLGLAIVRGLAERYNGRVEVDSGDEGGARVTVVFPPPRVDLVALEQGTAPEDEGDIDDGPRWMAQ